MADGVEGPAVSLDARKNWISPEAGCLSFQTSIELRANPSMDEPDASQDAALEKSVEDI